MTVYVVLCGVKHEGEWIVGVYATLEDARSAAEVALGRYIDWVKVQDWTVGSDRAGSEWEFTKRGWDS
jgi:hypothetical protein